MDPKGCEDSDKGSNGERSYCRMHGPVTHRRRAELHRGSRRGERSLLPSRSGIAYSRD